MSCAIMCALTVPTQIVCPCLRVRVVSILTAASPIKASPCSGQELSQLQIDNPNQLQYQGPCQSHVNLHVDVLPTQAQKSPPLPITAPSSLSPRLLTSNNLPILLSYDFSPASLLRCCFPRNLTMGPLFTTTGFLIIITFVTESNVRVRGRSRLATASE